MYYIKIVCARNETVQFDKSQWTSNAQSGRLKQNIIIVTAIDHLRKCCSALFYNYLNKELQFFTQKMKCPLLYERN